MSDFSNLCPKLKIHFPLHINSQWNAFIRVSVHLINIQGGTGWRSIHGFFWNCSKFPSQVQVHASWTVFTFYHETPDALSCKRSSNSKLSCRSKQFNGTSPDIWNNKHYSPNKWVCLRLHCQFAILITTMKTPKDFKTLWTKRFEQFVRNKMLLRTKPNVLVTERNALRTECFWG